MKVAVCMIAFNQQEFIAQAIESVLMQKTNFPFELVIGDDCSTDRTQAVCQNYAAKFPEKVKYFRREKNIGMMPNLIETLRACSDAEYIAMCEGDDYWTAADKLQQQVDFLEAHSDFSFCCHNHLILKNGELQKQNPGIGEDIKVLQTEDYLLDPFFHTSSYFFRSAAQPRPYPDWYQNVLAGDHFLVLLLSLKGKIAYLNREMSVFRIHGSSVSRKTKHLEIKRNFLYHLAAFNEYSAFKFTETISRVTDRWNLVNTPLESDGYFEKIAYLCRHFGFYLKNYSRVGGWRLLIKYLLPDRILNKGYGDS